MNRTALAVLVAVPVVGFALLVGCAEGALGDPNRIQGLTRDEDGGATETPLPPKEAPPKFEDEPADEEEEAPTDGGAVKPKDAGSTTSSSSTSSSSSSTSSSGGTTTDPCNVTSSCSTGAGSKDLGYMTGDQGAAVKTVTGAAGQWLKITLGEDSLGSHDISMRATLTSPPNSNFDLFLHFKQRCSTADAKSENATGTDVARAVWGDGFGQSDDRWVLIEVRLVSGTCDPAAKWTLKLEGNK